MLLYRNSITIMAVAMIISSSFFLHGNSFPWDDPTEWDKMTKTVRYESSRHNRVRCEHYKFLLLCAPRISEKIKEEIEQVDCFNQQCIEQLSVLFGKAVALSIESEKNECAQGVK